MKKNVLFSLLAVGVAPTAAMADANVAVATDQAKDWAGDASLTVTGGDLIYSSGAEVTRGYALLPGKYKLSATATNATVTAVVGDKSYALGQEFMLAEKTVVTIKAVSDGKSTTGLNANEFTFGNVAFTLVFDFENVQTVIDLQTLLAQIINIGDEGLAENTKWKEGGSLALEASQLGNIIKEIKTGDYDTYVEYTLWDAANSTKLAELKAQIEAFAKKMNAEVESQKAYDEAASSLDGVQNTLDGLTSADGAWTKADEQYTKPRNKDAYDKLVSDLKAKQDELAEAYKNGNANTVEVDNFITEFNKAVETLKKNIATDDADAAAWDRVNTLVSNAQQAYNDANVALGNLLKADNYKDMLTEAQTALRAELQKVNEAAKSNGETRASEQSAENEADNTKVLNAAIAAINQVKDDYTAKYNTSEANKTAADAVVKTLTDHINAIKGCEDVVSEYAEDIKAIEDAIADLDKQNAADYASPYAMVDASYTVNDGADIQTAIDALTAKAKDVLDNYNAYQALIKNTLQSDLDKAKAAVAKLDIEAYSASSHFAATAEDLQKTVSDIVAEIEAAYKDKTAATKQADIEAEISDASNAIKQYQADAEAAKKLYDDITKALTAYDKSISDLKTTATDPNAKVGAGRAATPAAGTGATYGERIKALGAASKQISDDLTAANAKNDAEHLAALQAITLNADINTDAANLKSWYGDDKKQSDLNDRLEAAQNMWQNVTDYVAQVQATIDSHQTGGSDEWLEGNADGQLGNKYTELTEALNKLETELAAEKAKIPALGDINESNAAEYYAKLSEIHDAVEAIKTALSSLEKDAAAQIEKVKNENAAQKATTERNADRYQGAKKTYEEQLAAIKGFVFDPTVSQTYLEDYEAMVDETLNAAIAQADEAKEAGHMADAISDIKTLIDEFFNSTVYSDAKTAAESWAANVDAYNTLTADYDAVQSRLDAVKAYYEALLTQIEANSFMKGDVTADGNIMVDDYMQLLDIVLDSEQPEPGTVEFERADVNSDGKLNISDVTLVATRVVTGSWPSGGPVTDSPAKAQRSESFSLTSEQTADGQRIAINLNNYNEYVAGQMDIILPAGATVLSETATDRANGQQIYSNDLGNGVHRIVFSGLEGGALNAGETLIYLEVSGSGAVSATNVIFSDAYGKATEFRTQGSATAIDGVEAESSLKQKVYSVGGQIMNGLKKGLNIIRKADGTTQKVVNK